MPTPGTRGRRPAGSETRAAIETAARKRFAEVGYPRTTMRAIAADAGVDPRLITHFFGSKQQLFVAVVELPFDPETTFDALLSGSGADTDVGSLLANFVLETLEQPRSRTTMLSVIRAAASEEEAARQIQDLLATRLLAPLARHLGTDQPELRAALIASQVVGLAFARHVVGFSALRAEDRRGLAVLLAQVFNVYLGGEPAPTARARK